VKQAFTELIKRLSCFGKQ
jgi:hypothetical protein